jgi:hypothetical protein
MANPHKYGFRFVRSLAGAVNFEPITRPIASGYAPHTGTDSVPGTACNLNIGDPIQMLNDGTMRLAQPGQASGGSNVEDRVMGVVVGFPRVMIAGAPRPSAFYPSGTVYAVPDRQTLVSYILAAGNVFEITCDAAIATATTLQTWQAVVGSTARIGYTAVTAGAGQPKANPTLRTTTLSHAANSVQQVRVVGLCRDFDVLDAAAADVRVEVVFNMTQFFPTAVGSTSDVADSTAEASLET